MSKITKEKIAISLDRPLLTLIDALVDGTTLRSRSQAIESLVRKGISQEYVHDAVILVKKEHQQLLLAKVHGKTLIAAHLSLLERANVKRCYLITPTSALIEKIQKNIPRNSKVHFTFIEEKEQKGNVHALQLVKEKLSTNFVVLLGDTYNDFDLKKMILFHLNKNKIATVGLMSHNQPNLYSSVELEGDRIVAFRNKKKSQSFVIDAGIYVCKPTLFSSFSKNTSVLERDVLPKLCSGKHAQGYFTYGEYRHLGG